jgi:hypothetical protein
MTSMGEVHVMESSNPNGAAQARGAYLSTVFRDVCALGDRSRR